MLLKQMVLSMGDLVFLLNHQHHTDKLNFMSFNILLSQLSSFEMTLSSKCDLKTGVRGRSRSLKMAAFDRLHTTFYWSAIVNVALSCSPNLETGWCQHMKVTMSVSKTPQNQSSFRTEQRSIHQSISVVQFKINNNIKLFHESMMDLFDHWRVAQVIIS